MNITEFVNKEKNVLGPAGYKIRPKKLMLLCYKFIDSRGTDGFRNLIYI